MLHETTENPCDNIKIKFKKMEIYYEKNADFIATYIINGMFTKW